jgi:hypothetical protein
VDHHARVLQQRIEVAPIRGRREQALEGVRGEQHEGEETGAHQAEHTEHARGHLVGQVRAEQAHREHPHAEHQTPQQERPLVATPGRGYAVTQRQRAVGVHGYVLHGEIVGGEGIREAAEGEGDEQRLRLRRRPRHPHPRSVAVRRARERQDALHERHDERERQRELAEFGDHFSCSVFCACSTACAASGGM